MGRIMEGYRQKASQPYDRFIKQLSVRLFRACPFTSKLLTKCLQKSFVYPPFASRSSSSCRGPLCGISSIIAPLGMVGGGGLEGGETIPLMYLASCESKIEFHRGMGERIGVGSFECEKLLRKVLTQSFF